MKNPFKRLYSAKERLSLDFLATCPLFEGLGDKELYPFISLLYLRNYGNEEVVFFRKDPGMALYIVKKGKVELNIDVNDSLESFAVMRPGDYFGDAALLPESKRIYNAVSQSDDCQLYAMPQVGLLDILNKNSEIKAQVYENMAVSYDKTLSHIFSAYKKRYGFFELKHAFNQE